MFVNSPYSGYGDGAVRVGNSIIVGPMEILKQLQKNDNKILAKKRRIKRRFCDHKVLVLQFQSITL